MRAEPRSIRSSTPAIRCAAWLLALVVCGAAPLLAQTKPPWEPWVPFDCPAPAPGQPGQDAADGAGAADERPLLRSDEAVARRFEAELRAFLFGSRWQALVDDLGRSAADAVGLGRFLPPPGDDPALSALAEALRKGTVDLRIERVVSWRCRRDRHGRRAPARRIVFYVEATLPEGLDGAPNAGRTFRALLSGDGTLGSWGMGQAVSPDDAPPFRRLPTLDQAAALLADRAGGPLDHVQYVLAGGYPACYSIPCVAGSRGDTLYVLDHRGLLFAFALDPRPRDEVLPPPGHTCIGGPCAGDPWVLEIRGHWLAGELLNPPGACDRAPSPP